MEGATLVRHSRRKITEEVFNSATHVLGFIAGIVGLVLGLFALTGSKSFTVGFVLYCVCLIMLMAASALYHALIFTRARRVFQAFDHAGIFLLIAGTYTPFVIMLYGGVAQTLLLMVVWTLSIAGIVFGATLPRLMSRWGVGIYITLGWLALVFIPKLSLLPAQVIWLVVFGGLVYTLGAALLAIKKPFVHVVWHVCVVAAACLHFFAITKLT